MVFRTSVPICPRSPVRDGADLMSRVFCRDVLIVYVTALAYTLIDLFVFHLMSVWLTMIVEAFELLPILVGVGFYCMSRRGSRIGRLPRMLYVPLISTSIQLQILLVAGIYRHIGLS